MTDYKYKIRNVGDKTAILFFIYIIGRFRFTGLKIQTQLPREDYHEIFEIF